MRRRAVAQGAQVRSIPDVIPAPTLGWIESDPTVSPRPGGAAVVENWFVDERGIRMRAGAQKVADVGSARVSALFTYETATIERLFAGTSTTISDITNFDPVNQAPVVVSGLTGGEFSTAQFATEAGQYIYVVNGSDSARLFDGSSWQAVTDTSSPISITGVQTNVFSHVWIHRGRLWFIERNSLVAWALPIAAIGGAAIRFSLAGIFKGGGALVFGATWSLDAGDGQDDQILFMTDQGEVAVYEGSDPATNFGIVGVYDITPPLGPNATMEAGGDLLIGTVDGAVPMSGVLQKDPAALKMSAVSYSINRSWQEEAARRDATRPWQLLKWADGNRMFVTLPHTQSALFVANLQTGAWSKYTGWDAQSVAVFGGNAYMGDSAGSICQMEAGGSDNGALYTAKYCGNIDHGHRPTDFRTVHSMRGTFLAQTPFIAKLSVTMNYGTTFPAAPAAAPQPAAPAVWDTAIWDQSVWDDSNSEVEALLPVVTDWVSVDGGGFVFAPQVQITSGSNRAPIVQLVSLECMSIPGTQMV